MVRYLRAFENPEALVAKPAPLNPIHVEKSCMRGQAGPYARMNVVFRPAQQSYETSPVWFVPEVRRLRLGAGHDEAIEMAAPKIIDAGIEATHTPPAGIGPGNLRQR